MWSKNLVSKRLIRLSFISFVSNNFGVNLIEGTFHRPETNSSVSYHYLLKRLQNVISSDVSVVIGSSTDLVGMRCLKSPRTSFIVQIIFYVQQLHSKNPEMILVKKHDLDFLLLFRQILDMWHSLDRLHKFNFIKYSTVLQRNSIFLKKPAIVSIENIYVYSDRYGYSDLKSD